MMGEVVERG